MLFSLVFAFSWSFLFRYGIHTWSNYGVRLDSTTSSDYRGYLVQLEMAGHYGIDRDWIDFLVLVEEDSVTVFCFRRRSLFFVVYA